MLWETLAKHLEYLRAWESWALTCNVLGQNTRSCSSLFPSPPLREATLKCLQAGLHLFLMHQPCSAWFSYKASLFLIDFFRHGEEPWEIEPQGTWFFWFFPEFLDLFSASPKIIMRIFRPHHPENQNCLVSCLSTQGPRHTYLLIKALMQQFQKGPPLYLFFKINLFIYSFI